MVQFAFVAMITLPVSHVGKGVIEGGSVTTNGGVLPGHPPPGQRATTIWLTPPARVPGADVFVSV